MLNQIKPLDDFKQKLGCVMALMDFPEWEDLLVDIDKDDLYNDDPSSLEKEPHITILYGIIDVLVPKETILDEIKKMQAFDVRLKSISLFETNPDYDVLKIDVESDEINAIHEKLSKSLLPAEQSYPTYKPHITLAKIKKGTGNKYVNDRIEDFATNIEITQVAYSDKNREKTIIQLNGR